MAGTAIWGRRTWQTLNRFCRRCGQRQCQRRVGDHLEALWRHQCYYDCLVTIVVWLHKIHIPSCHRWAGSWEGAFLSFTQEDALPLLLAREKPKAVSFREKNYLVWTRVDKHFFTEYRLVFFSTFPAKIDEHLFHYILRLVFFIFLEVRHGKSSVIKYRNIFASVERFCGD